MDFELTEELRMLRDMTRKFAETEFTPVSEECDREEKDTPEIRKKAAEQGLIGAWISEDYGGAGVGILGNCIIAEELCRVDMAIAMNVLAGSFGLEAVYFFGSEEQKQKYIPPVCAGESLWAGCFTEPNAGTDAGGYRTRAVKDGNDYVITGQKMFISNGSICDFYMAQLVTNPDKKITERFSQIVIPAKAPGITRNKLHGKMGLRANDIAEISFDEVRVPQENLVGTEGKGFYQLMQFFNATRCYVGAEAVGVAQGCLDKSIQYCKERTVFGAPLGTFQLSQQKLTEMVCRIELLRNLVYKVAWQADTQGQPDHILSSIVKYFGGLTAVFCANAAVELHGGYGYFDEYAVSKFYRDAKSLEIFEGTKEAEIMTIGRALMAK